MNRWTRALIVTLAAITVSAVVAGGGGGPYPPLFVEGMTVEKGIARLDLNMETYDFHEPVATSGRAFRMPALLPAPAGGPVYVQQCRQMRARTMDYDGYIDFDFGMELNSDPYPDPADPIYGFGGSAPTVYMRMDGSIMDPTVEDFPPTVAASVQSYYADDGDFYGYVTLCAQAQRGIYRLDGGADVEIGRVWLHVYDSYGDLMWSRNFTFAPDQGGFVLDLDHSVVVYDGIDTYSDEIRLARRYFNPINEVVSYKYITYEMTTGDRLYQQIVSVPRPLYFSEE